MEKRTVERSNEVELDLSGIPQVLLEKIQSAPEDRLNLVLVNIAKSDYFKENPQAFNYVLTQTNPESQMIMYHVFSHELLTNDYIMEYLLFLTDKPDKQRRVLEYALIPDIIYNEFFALSMLSIEEDYIEERLRNCFKSGLINSTHDFIEYRRKFEQEYKSMDINQRVRKV